MNNFEYADQDANWLIIMFMMYALFKFNFILIF